MHLTGNTAPNGAFLHELPTPKPFALELVDTSYINVSPILLSNILTNVTD
jgi:hypothetical protein